MDNLTFLKQARKFADRYRITDGKKFRLKNFDPDDTSGFDKADKPRAQEGLLWGQQMIGELQEKLYAQDCWAVLLIFQAMDAAGKDSAIKHVLSGVNPQGCEVHSFKEPSSEELDHDFLWRCTKRLPERGRIGIFNRSYYEETLVVRVHQDFLLRQKLHPSLITKNIWRERFEDISNLERYLTRNGIAVVKFFLNVSREEQKKRFLDRINDPSKNWKFSLNDVQERDHWKHYMEAYEDTIRNTATKHAPWYVIPADHKWFTRLVVASAIVECLNGLKPQYPQPTPEALAGLEAARESLEHDENDS
jgi:PPK2 family polyphosphate:nucleotide phosphotransferase